MMKQERGNVLFILLLGVALFAALSMAVVQVFRSADQSAPTGFGQSEKRDVDRSDLQQFLEAVRLTVMQMSATQGIPEANIDFKNDVYEFANDTANTDNINGNCTTDSCHVFMPYNPKGLFPLTFSNIAASPQQTNATLPKNGHGQVHQIILDGVGSAAPELVFLIHGVKAEFCNSYNEKQGITTSYTSSTTLTSIGENSGSSTPAAFSGSFDTNHDFGAGATDFAGKKSFCAPAYADTADHRLAIWHVLKVR